MWQYSKFVRGGHTILKVNQPDWALAALSPALPTERSATLVLTNNQVRPTYVCSTEPNPGLCRPRIHHYL